MRYYIAVYRGILVGIETDREAAEALVRGFNIEKLLLWHPRSRPATRTGR